MNNPTEIHLRWNAGVSGAATALSISVPCRALTSDELHTVANVVAAIEEMRAIVIGELPELVNE